MYYFAYSRAEMFPIIENKSSQFQKPILEKFAIYWNHMKNCCIESVCMLFACLSLIE
jgi:hypothetical protein